MDLTVVTTSIPERAPQLAELETCIAAQTVQPKEWLIDVDHNRDGFVPCMNRLADRVSTEWMFECDDDDLFDPDHFETIAERLDDDVDFVYSWPRVDPPGWIGERGLQVIHPIETLRAVNWIASAAAIRVSFWQKVGGYREDAAVPDHDFLIRALDAGCRFRCIPEVTWTYRLGPWPHMSQGEL